MAQSKHIILLTAFVVCMEFRRSSIASLSLSKSFSPQCNERGLDILEKQFDQQRAARQIAMNTSLGEDWSFDIYEPEANCFSKERIGSIKADVDRYGAFGDGPKFICGVDFIARRTANDGKKCLVYSVGSNNDIAFEKSVHTNMKGCEIHTFDPTLTDRFVGDEYATFHPWGLGLDGVEETFKDKTWTTKSFATIIQELGHENGTIDVLKIDCEGCEYKTIPPLFDLISSGKIKVNQILIELHLTQYWGKEWINNNEYIDSSQLKDFFRSADRANMRVFSKERNGWGCEGRDCVEYSFASETFLREANKDTICPSH